MEKPNSRIHVCARVRPIIAEDYKLGTVIRSSPEICVHLKGDGQTIKMTKDVYDIKMFRVDHTFDGVTSQIDVYNASFKRIVVDALGGFNGTGMVYGQTGSGKSHTMFGSGEEPGLVQCAINDVFSDVRLRIDRGLVANVFLSFYQLYVEQAYDLLVGPVGGKTDCIALAVREDIIKGAFVENLQYIYVDDEESTMDVLRLGLRNRKVNSTQFNMSSSRSHAIFQMYLDFEEPEDSNESATSSVNGANNGKRDYRGEQTVNGTTKKFNVRRRILTFVDLAGSERVQAHHQSKSKAQFKEAVTINKSISALGNCIQALANNSAEQEQGFAESYNYQSKRNLHIPFRDCKLTRLLAEPLGGNSKTCIIVNIGPCTYNFEETKSTLKFAKRAMSVKKSVKKSEIEQLQVQDVLTAEPQEEEPSPLRPAIGTKKTSSVKVSRIVVRESPEERMRRNTDFGTDYAFDENMVVSGEGGQSFNGSYNTLNNFESVRDQLYATSRVSSPAKSSSYPNGDNGGYVLHLPAGTEFDTLGKVTVSGPDNVQQATVRLNLSDFLKACQTKATISASSLTSTTSDATNGNTASTINDHDNANTIENHTNLESHFKLSLPDDSLALETDLTPINAISSKSNFNSFLNNTTPAKDLSLDWATTPASSTKPPLSPGLSRLMNPKAGASLSATQDEPTPQKPPSQRILLPSPHPNLENIPTLRLSENGDKIDSISTPSSPEKYFAEVVTHRTQRKFVWERGSGEPYASTIEVTPMLNRHRGRIADVAAIAPVSVNNYFKTYAEEPTTETGRSKSAPPRSPRAKKVTSFLKHTPSADLDVSLRSSNSTPGTDDKKKASPHSTHSSRRLSLSVVTVRDETNSMPRSFAPQPTPSPKYSSPADKNSAKKTKEVGPYAFHKSNPSPPRREIRLDTKKQQRGGSAKPPSKLAATIKPFGKGGVPGATEKVDDELPLDLEGKLNAVSQMDENGNRPHSVLISLVHQLRDELQRKEEEITSLKTFILNN